MLANDIDYVIGVDTHKDSHSVAVVNATGGVISALDVTASEAGDREIRRCLKRHLARRVFRLLNVTGTRPHSCRRRSGGDSHAEPNWLVRWGVTFWDRLTVSLQALQVEGDGLF